MTLANIFRSIARIFTVALIPIIVLYLLFVGLQVASGESGFLGLFLNMAMLLLLAIGFVVAWRREGLGAALAFGALAGFIVLGLTLFGFRAAFSASPLVWPIALIVAIIKPQSFDPVPVWIVVTSWILIAIPICLFFASWLMRREPIRRG